MNVIGFKGKPIKIILIDSPLIITSENLLVYKSKVMSLPADTKDISILENNFIFFRNDKLQINDKIYTCDGYFILNKVLYRICDTTIVETPLVIEKNEDNNKYMGMISGYINKFIKYSDKNENKTDENKTDENKTDENKTDTAIDTKGRVLYFDFKIEKFAVFSDFLFICYFSRDSEGDYVIDSGKINTIISIYNKNLELIKTIVLKGKIEHFAVDRLILVFRGELLLIDYVNDKYNVYGATKGLFGTKKSIIPRDVTKMEILRNNNHYILVLLRQKIISFYSISGLKLKKLDDFLQQYKPEIPPTSNRKLDGVESNNDVKKVDSNNEVENEDSKKEVEKVEPNDELSTSNVLNQLIKGEIKIYKLNDSISLKSGTILPYEEIFISKEENLINFRENSEFDDFFISRDQLFLVKNSNEIYWVGYGFISLNIELSYKNIITLNSGIFIDKFYESLKFIGFYKNLICKIENYLFIFQDDGVLVLDGEYVYRDIYRNKDGDYYTFSGKKVTIENDESYLLYKTIGEFTYGLKSKEIDIYDANKELLGNIIFPVHSFSFTDSKLYVLSGIELIILDGNIKRYEVSFNQVIAIFDEKWILFFKKECEYYQVAEESLDNEFLQFEIKDEINDEVDEVLEDLADKKVKEENEIKYEGEIEEIRKMICSDWNSGLMVERYDELENLALEVENLVNTAEDYKRNARNLKEKYKKKWFW